MSALDWEGARNILCIRLDNLGDVLMCTPAMRALAGAGPAGRRLTLLASSAGAAAAPYIPELDAVIPYAAPWAKQPPGGRAHDASPGILATLRAARFDGAVVFTCFSQSALPAALLCHQAGIPLRAAHCRENPYGLLTDWVLEPEPAIGIRHEVRRQLDLVAALGCQPRTARLSFLPPQADVDWARRRLAAAGIGPGEPWLLLHPGASAPSRRYPASHWARLLGLLAAEARLKVVLAGTAAEATLIAGILADAAVPPGCAIDLSGELDLGRLGALVSLARLAVTNNSGPAHLCAALGTPVVDIYALTNPQHTPWQVPHRVLYHDVPCKYCYRSECPEGHHACLEKVEPAHVASAIGSLLEQTGLREYSDHSPTT